MPATKEITACSAFSPAREPKRMPPIVNAAVYFATVFVPRLYGNEKTINP
jgi:hypothetical protein